MAIISPTVTATEPHSYREQMERINPFAERIHVDFMDGDFAPTTSIGLDAAWWNDSEKIDIHLMYRKPLDHLLELVTLNPRLVIVHAEADGNFIELATELHLHGIKAGVALLSDTSPDKIEPAMEHIDHVLIFSGNLGHFGGTVDLSLLDKVRTIRDWKPGVEIGWDGGISVDNAAQLVAGGVDVLNVGGFIQRADDPAAAYAKLQEVIQEKR